MVDGYGSDGSCGLVPQALQSVDLPFDLAESYVTSSLLQESLALVGVPRSLIQGWSEVAEAKICIAEIGPIQAGSAEIGPSQISCVEVCIAQVRIPQIGVGQRAVRADPASRSTIKLSARVESGAPSSTVSNSNSGAGMGRGSRW